MERMLRRVIGGDVRLLTKLDAALPPVFADAGQMEQVVMNLVLNARDAMPDGGDILVTTSATTLRSFGSRGGSCAPSIRRSSTCISNAAGSRSLNSAHVASTPQPAT